MRFLVLALALSSGACVDLVGAAAGRYVEREEKRFAVTGRPELTLSTFDGAIEVRPWDRTDVEVVVEKRASSKESVAAITVDTKQTGTHIDVDVRAPRMSGFTFHAGRSAKLIVSVPSGTNVAAKSGDGAIDIEGITGTIDLHSGDGGIRARGLSGDVRATTGDGTVRLSGAFHSLKVHTGDGSVTVTATGAGRTAEDWDISTGDGAVTLELPKAFGAELDAHTGDGRIHLEDVTVSNVSGAIGRSTLQGRLGDGGAALRIRTGDGSITLRSVPSSGTGDSR